MNYDRPLASGSAIGRLGGSETAVERPVRRIEGARGIVNKLQVDAIKVLDRMRELRGRVLGINEASSPPKPNAPQPVRPEFGELEHDLSVLADLLGEIRVIATHLEEI